MSQVLSLLQQIDSQILESHLQYLTAAYKDDKTAILQRKEISHRVLEVASILFNGDQAEQYSRAVLDSLTLPLDETIDDGTIRLVLRHLRRGELMIQCHLMRIVLIFGGASQTILLFKRILAASKGTR